MRMTMAKKYWIIGGIGLVAAIAAIVFFLRKKNNNRKNIATSEPENSTNPLPTSPLLPASPLTKEEMLAQQAIREAGLKRVGLWHEVTEADAKAAEAKPALPKAASYKPFFGFLQVGTDGQKTNFDPLADRQIKAMWETRKKYYTSLGTQVPELKNDTPFIQAMGRNIFSRFAAKPSENKAQSMSIVPDPIYFKEATLGGGALSGSQRWYTPDEITKLIASQL